MESQFENRILPFHFGINPLATYAPMEYFAHHLERTEREVSSMDSCSNIPLDSRWYISIFIVSQFSPM